jgi:tetratricopeptide (TPR) repeat protein
MGTGGQAHRSRSRRSGVLSRGFRWRDRQEGARRLLPATSRFARQLTGYWQVTDERHPLRPALGQLAADACHLVAYQAFDQGDRVQAVEWYRSSAELAARCGAQGMYVFALCGVAYMYARDGRVDFADAVLDQLKPVAKSAADYCYVAGYRAHTHACAGRRDAARRELDQAAAQAEQTHNDAPSAWLGIPDSSWVQRQEVIVLSHLGDPQALPTLDRLNAATSAVFQRFQVTLQANYALAHAKASNIDEAAAFLAAAAAKNQNTLSMEKARIILEARRALPAVDSPALRAADELLRDTPALRSALWTATTR